MVQGSGPGGFGSGSGQADPELAGNAAFRLPNTAVAAFLAALKAKDKDRLAQTTADRAAIEADEKHRKIFAAIKEMSISDDELDEMAKALEGFQVVSMLPPQSTRRVGVVIVKMSGLDRYQRTIMTRQERDGWKVLDIEKMYDFKTMPGFRTRRPR